MGNFETIEYSKKNEKGFSLQDIKLNNFVQKKTYIFKNIEKKIFYVNLHYNNLMNTYWFNIFNNFSKKLIVNKLEIKWISNARKEIKKYMDKLGFSDKSKTIIKVNEKEKPLEEINIEEKHRENLYYCHWCQFLFKNTIQKCDTCWMTKTVLNWEHKGLEKYDYSIWDELMDWEGNVYKFLNLLHDKLILAFYDKQKEIEETLILPSESLDWFIIKNKSCAFVKNMLLIQKKVWKSIIVYSSDFIVKTTEWKEIKLAKEIDFLKNTKEILHCYYSYKKNWYNYITKWYNNKKIFNWKEINSFKFFTVKDSWLKQLEIHYQGITKPKLYSV